MKIVYTATFKKHLKKRISPNPKLYKKFKERLGIFLIYPNDPLLKNHKLKGN